MNSQLQFLCQFACQPFTIGALWPSSKALSKVVADSCDITPGGTIVELGAGTGAFTRQILKRLDGRSRFVAVEINRSHAMLLRRRFPQCEVIQDSAEKIRSYMGNRRAACVVSGLPWGNMFPSKQDRLLETVLEVLAPGGQFIAFAYLHAFWFPTSRRFRGLLTRRFDRVESTAVIWRNLPPAIVIRCRKREHKLARKSAVNHRRARDRDVELAPALARTNVNL
jgi:phospholipid N-methyltransferase